MLKWVMKQIFPEAGNIVCKNIITDGANIIGIASAVRDCGIIKRLPRQLHG